MKHDKSIRSDLPGGLAASFVPMREPEAISVARDHFGLHGCATRLATEKDDTFKISAGDARFILKVANPSEDDLEIDLQVKLLEHIEATAPDLPVPRVIANQAGEQHFVYMDHVGQRRRVRLMTYLDGQPLSEIQSSAFGREQIGRLLARLRLATSNFAHVADSRILPWDVKHLRMLEGLMDQINDPAKRKLLAAGLERFEAIEPRLRKCRTQVLHNDFSKSNIVVDAASSAFVTGVIDFGDAVRTAVAIDVSTAVLNQMPAHADGNAFSDARDVLRGYLTVTDLTEEELFLIPHLAMGRVVARSLLSISLANATPTNAAYLLRNTEQGWSQLDWFLSRSIDGVSSEFQKQIFRTAPGNR